MADGHRTVFMQQQHRHRLADNIAPADHHAGFARDAHPRRMQQLHHAGRRARQEGVIPDHDVADIRRMERIHVLERGDGLDDRLILNVRRQRELAEDPVDVAAAVEARHQRQQFVLCGVLRQRKFLRINPGLRAGLFLVIDINPGGRVVAYNNHRQARHDALFLQPGGFLRHLAAHLCRYGLAVNDNCHVNAHPFPFARSNAAHTVSAWTAAAPFIPFCLRLPYLRCPPRVLPRCFLP